MNKKHIILLVLQIVAVIAAGLISGDTVYASVNAVIGIAFNFLVSLNFSAGFIFGFFYAVTNGILAFQTNVYATFVFMIFLQAPMAIYSFVKWHKKKNSEDSQMKIMNKKQIVMLLSFMAILGIVMYFVLNALNSSSVIFDDIFFVCSVSACLLLAMYFKNAYVITLLSGLFGTVLWTVQYLKTRQGLSVAVFYCIVFVNSLIAVYQQYKPTLKKGVSKNE
ncbi:MAG: nicotinamide riboside transporter PnuC [Clostridia bacterium]|nr:nicotinamide riboside transporter PnuC [Clostridia bacterium]